jgi:hypothetical protein
MLYKHDLIVNIAPVVALTGAGQTGKSTLATSAPIADGRAPPYAR